MAYDNNFVVAVDFDNTITMGSTYEKTGILNPVAKTAIEKIKNLGCIIVLWTTRTGKDLDEAIGLLDQWEIPIDYVNEYPLRESGNKINVDLYIDDKSCVNGDIDWNAYINYIMRCKK